MRAFEVENYINAQVSRTSEVFMGLHLTSINNFDLLFVVVVDKKTKKLLLIFSHYN